MAYDGFANYTIVQELKNKLVNGKIDKIYEPNFDEIILGIYANGAKYALDLVTNSQYYRASLTTHAKPNPNQAPNFCMTLRKYLLGTHITKIETKHLERIIFIELEGFNKSKDFSSKTLVIELMGKYSNILLVDNEGKIIDSLKHFSIASGGMRDIYSGATYRLPPSDKLDFMEIANQEEWYQVLQNHSHRMQNTSLSTVISSVFTGISKHSILYFEKSLHLTDEITEKNCDFLFAYLTQMLAQNQNVIGVPFENDYALQWMASSKENSLQFNFFLDDYYTQKENDTTFKVYRDNLLKLILNKLKKLQSKLDAILAKVQECKEAEQYQLYGELITSNLYRIPDYHTDSLTLENYYNDNQPVTIALDPSISPSANAKKFFKKYKKLKNAKEFVDAQKVSLLNDISYLESIVYEIGTATTIADVDEIYSEIQESEIKIRNDGKNKDSSKSKTKLKTNKKGFAKVGEPFRFTVDGFTVFVGKNNKQNDYLTTKLANKEDIWFHVKDFHGSHVILRTENKIPSQETINKCAKLAKEHSKAVDSSNVPVDYTYVKYVKKPSGSKPGMVIYTNNKTVNV